MTTRTVVINGKEIKLSKVKSVTPVGERQVYDIEVQADHNFYAGGILTHNCEYHELLDYYSTRYGEEIYKFPDSFLHYKHRKLAIAPASPDKRTLRGRTRMFSCIDELGWFDASQGSDSKVRVSAEQIYLALTNSLETVRNSAKNLIMRQKYNNLLPAYAYNVSSPSSINDKISTLVEANRHNDGSVFTFQLATWEYNPNYKIEDFEERFANNPQDTWRDFGAVPPISGNPFIMDDNGELEKAFDKKQVNRIEYEYITHKNLKSKRTYKAADCKFIAASEMPRSVLAIDAGLSKNSFAMVIGHWNTKDKEIRWTGAIEIAPEVGKNILSYPKIFEKVIKPAIKEFNVGAVLADRWNSVQLLQTLEDEIPNLYCEQYSVKYEDFIQFRSYLQDGIKQRFPKLEMPVSEIRTNTKDYPHGFKGKPMAHLYFQMITVEDAKKTVTKGHGWTDDIFRAAVLASAYLLDDEFRKEHLQGSVLSNLGSRRALVSGMASGSGVASSKTGGGIVSAQAGGGAGNVFARG